MKSRNFFYNGILIGTTGSDSSGPFPYVDFRGRERDLLNVNVDTKHGNFKSPNPQDYERQYHTWLQGNYYSRNSSTTAYTDVAGCLGVAPLYDSSMFDYDTQPISEALNKLIEQVRGKLDLAVDIAEAGQTVKLVKSVSALLRYMRRQPLGALRKSFEFFNKHGWRGATKGAGSLWLQYVYGVKPLVGDIYDAVIEVSRSIEPLLVVRTHASSKRSMVSRHYQPSFGGDIVVTHESSTRCSFDCRFRFGTETQNLLGRFTSMNPVSIAWELTPFSFVADWVIDVGGYLRALETSIAYGNTFESGYRTITHQYTAKNSLHSDSTSGAVHTLVNAEGKFDAGRKRREILTSFPAPMLPRFDVRLGSGRLLNAASLISQLLRG